MHASELPQSSRSRTRAPGRRPAQDSTAGKRGADQAARAATPGRPMSPAAVRALQRSAGNAAVTRILTAQRRTPDTGRGQGLPVQRALVNDQREFGPGQLRAPRDEDQANLEKVFPKTSEGAYKQFPDPMTFASALVVPLAKHLSKIGSKGSETKHVGASDWVKGINSQRGEGGDRGPYRRNCIDATRSFLASWSGNPTAAAGIHNPTGVEQDGPPRTKRWLGTNWRTEEPSVGTDVKDVWGAVARRLKNAGHGASSIVVFEREETGLVHAVNGVNHKGSVVWVDPQMGEVSKTPLYNGSAFMTITLDPRFAPVDPPESHASALSMDFGDLDEYVRPEEQRSP